MFRRYAPPPARLNRNVRGRNLRAALVPVLFASLSGCGHMTPYSEKPLDYAELYNGVQHRYQLRIPFKVTLYEPLPSQSYISSEWITLDGSPPELSSDSSEALLCPEGTTTFASRYKMRGRVVLGPDMARVQMEDLKTRKSGQAEWRSYKFNGEYRLVRGVQSPARVAKAQAEAAARALGTKFVNDPCSLSVGSNGR